MNELEALSQQILERVEEKGKQKISQKEQELAMFMEENRLRLVEQQKARKKTIETRSQEEYERQKQSLNNEKRNRLLSEKQTILSAIYEEAVAEMTNWDPTSFQQFVENVLKQFDSQSVRVNPGEQTAAHFTATFKNMLQQTYPDLSIGTEIVPNKAGFIVEVGGVDYNFFFDQMVAEIKREFSPKLASFAFQKNE